MGYGWKILKAAVEQVILFPSELSFQAYVSILAQKYEGDYELVNKTDNDDGTVMVIVRKPYNQNDFLYRTDEAALLQGCSSLYDSKKRSV